MQASNLEFCLQLAKGIARQFGPNCEVVVHDLASNDPETSIVAIENGHVSGRRVGDGPSHVVLEALRDGGAVPEDRLSYLTKSEDGKILKSSTIYIRDDSGKAVGIFAINYDITNKEDKVKAIQFLNDTGAFLITKSGYKVCKYFGISKYTLYSYIDEAKAASEK